MRNFEEERFDKELAEALGRVAPPEGFESRVQQRIQWGSTKSGKRARGGGLWSGWRLQWATAVALVALVSGGAWSYQERERRRGELARDRTLAALRLTSEKLQLAKSRIHRVNQGDMQ